MLGLSPHWPACHGDLVALSCKSCLCESWVGVKVTHRYAGCAIQGCAVEDGGGADDQAEHDQAIDHKVLQGVPPVDG